MAILKTLSHKWTGIYILSYTHIHVYVYIYIKWVINLRTAFYGH